jgi:cytochrome b
MTTSGSEHQAVEQPLPAPLALWDLPIRIVHWSFVLLLPALWWTHEAGRMDLHQILGHVMLGLLAFRIYWGFAGSVTARFGHFLKGPRAILAYLRTLRGESGEAAVGHNPIGGWSAIVLLGLLVLQVGLGLIAIDKEGIVSGPLAEYVSFETAEAARDWHEQVFYILLGFVGLHVAAILFYLLVTHDNLVGPMLSGRKRLPGGTPPPGFAPAWRAALGLVLAAGLAFWVSQGAPVWP